MRPNVGLVPRLIDGTMDQGVMCTPEMRPGFKVGRLFDEIVLVSSEKGEVPGLCGLSGGYGIRGPGTAGCAAQTLGAETLEGRWKERVKRCRCERAHGDSRKTAPIGPPGRCNRARTPDVTDTNT